MSRRLFIRGRSSQSRLAALLGRDIADVRAELERGGGPPSGAARRSGAAPWYMVARRLEVAPDGTLWAALGFGRLVDVLDRTCPLRVVYNGLTGKVVGVHYQAPDSNLPLIALAEASQRPAAHVWAEVVAGSSPRSWSGSAGGAV